MILIFASQVGPSGAECRNIDTFLLVPIIEFICRHFSLSRLVFFSPPFLFWALCLLRISANIRHLIAYGAEQRQRAGDVECVGHRDTKI